MKYTIKLFPGHTCGICTAASQKQQLLSLPVPVLLYFCITAINVKDVEPKNQDWEIIPKQNSYRFNLSSSVNYFQGWGEGAKFNICGLDHSGFEAFSGKVIIASMSANFFHRYKVANIAEEGEPILGHFSMLLDMVRP